MNGNIQKYFLCFSASKCSVERFFTTLKITYNCDYNRDHSNRFAILNTEKFVEKLIMMVNMYD